MTKNHYQGMIIEGSFTDRIYLDTLDTSLQSAIFEDFQYHTCLVQVWVTTKPKDFFELMKLNHERKTYTYLKVYDCFEMMIHKKNLLYFNGNTEMINAEQGRHLYVVVTKTHNQEQ